MKLESLAAGNALQKEIEKIRDDIEQTSKMLEVVIKEFPDDTKLTFSAFNSSVWISSSYLVGYYNELIERLRNQLARKEQAFRSLV